jgi:hypothetical protein
MVFIISYTWLAETTNQQLTSQTTSLKVTPNCNHYQELQSGAIF